MKRTALLNDGLIINSTRSLSIGSAKTKQSAPRLSIHPFSNSDRNLKVSRGQSPSNDIEDELIQSAPLDQFPRTDSHTSDLDTDLDFSPCSTPRNLSEIQSVSPSTSQIKGSKSIPSKLHNYPLLPQKEDKKILGSKLLKSQTKKKNHNSFPPSEKLKKR